MNFFGIYTVKEYVSVDYMEAGGVLGACLNAVLIAIAVLVMFKALKIKANGTSMGALFLMVGYGFFGKNLLNILPIFLGAYCYAKFVKKEPFANYACLACFGCALAPVVTEIIFSETIPLPIGARIPIGIVVGMLIGFTVCPLTSHTAAFHKSFNQYNGGLSAGLMSIIVFAVYKNVALKAAGAEFVSESLAGDGCSMMLWIFAGLYVIAIIAGIVFQKGSLKNFVQILKSSGYQDDFLTKYGLGTTAINLGVTGLIFLIYMVCIGGKFNGQAVGAMLCLLCWTGKGTNPLHYLPIIAGYAVGSLISGTALSGTGLIVGICFASGMAPLAGHFGIIAGVVAGLFHFALVQNMAALHGGFDLYNGGFTAGLVSSVMVPIMEAFSRKKAEKKS